MLGTMVSRLRQQTTFPKDETMNLSSFLDPRKSSSVKSQYELTQKSRRAVQNKVCGLGFDAKPLGTTFPAKSQPKWTPVTLGVVYFRSKVVKILWFL